MRREVRMVRDPDVRSFLARLGTDGLGSTHVADCPTVARAPRIRTPRPGGTYSRSLPLRAESPVDWFVDGRSAGRGRARSVSLEAGRHVVRAVGTGGASASVTVIVR